ncbi:VpsF family polysaccharide biosynthesis protein [Aquamicrobium terrae]
MTARWTIGERALDRSRPAVPQPATLQPGSRGIVDLLFFLGVVALLSLSDFALEFFGLPYNSPGGSIIVKIHPATYLFSVALGLAVIANPNPVGYLASLLLRCMGSTFLLLACILLWIFISRYKGDQPASFLIDAIIVAAIIYMLFADVGERTHLAIARAVHVLMITNCCLAMIEGASGWRLFPFVMSDTEQVWEYRATALLGHPLGGALATGVYAIVLMTVKDVRGLSERWRLPIILLCMATMPFIGSRVSFTVVYMTAAAVLGLRLLRFLRGGAVSLRALVAVLVLLPLVALVIFALYQMGVFDNFINRFINDKGSANSRLRLFELFDGIGLINMLLGYRMASLETQVRLTGLAEGIENSWAGHAVRYGVVITGVLWFGIAAWFVDMLRSAGRGAILPLAYIFLILSTTVGISGKTTMMSVPAVIILALSGRSRNAALSRLPADAGNDVLSRIGRGVPLPGSGGVRLS